MDLTPQVSHIAEWQLAAAVSSAVVIIIIWPTHWKRKLYNYVICKSRQPHNSRSYTECFVSGRYLIIEALFVTELIKLQLMKFSWVDLVLFFVCPVLPVSRVSSYLIVFACHYFWYQRLYSCLTVTGSFFTCLASIHIHSHWFRNPICCKYSVFDHFNYSVK